MASFDGGSITSDAGGLLLGATDRRSGWPIGLPAILWTVATATLVEHEVGTLVGQRMFGLALGYEDVNGQDHFGTMCLRFGLASVRSRPSSPAV